MPGGRILINNLTALSPHHYHQKNEIELNGS